MTCGRCGACARWNLFAFNLVSLGLSIVTVTGCSFVWYNKDYYYYGDYGLGLFQFESTSSYSSGSCTSYSKVDDVTLETSLVAARAGGIIAIVALFLGFVGLCLTTFALVGTASKITWLISKILYCLALVGTGMTFSMYADEFCGGYCTPGAIGYVTIANGAFLIAMVSYCWCVPVPKKPCCRGGSCCDGDACCGCCGAETGALPEAHSVEKPPAATAAPQDYTYSRDSSMSGHQAVPVVVMPVHRTTTVENTPTGKKITEEVLHSDGSKTMTITHEQMDTGSSSSPSLLSAGGEVGAIANC